MATLVIPDPVPSPVEDAETIRKAVKGWGTDEGKLISVLAHRDAIQRKLIREAYEDLYKEDLVKRLESELSGDFEKAVYRWLPTPEERYAILAYVALKGNYCVIVEIASILDPEELLAVKRAYLHKYKHSLEEDVASHTSGDIRKFLVGLVSTYRCNGDDVKLGLAEREAAILCDAFQGKAFNHEEVIRIITTRSKAQLNAIFNRYRDEYGTSITKHLVGEPAANELLGILRTAVRCINNPTKYFEKVLRNALNMVGTDEDALTRVIVTHAERDLHVIKELYYARNSVPLAKAVCCQGNFRGLQGLSPCFNRELKHSSVSVSV